MTVPWEVQVLEVGSIIELYTLDATSIGGDVERRHGHTQLSSIWWQGHEFLPWPITSSAWELATDQPPTPTLSIGNVDTSISALCAAFDDLQGALVIRELTFGKYLDAANFGGVNPNADPTKLITSETYSIERKTSEDKTQVTFELASPLNFQNVQLPGRQIITNVCGWKIRGGYRGPYCGYTGPAVAKLDDTPTTDITLDACGGRPKSCKLRFGETNPLPYGGFPAAQLTNTQ